VAGHGADGRRQLGGRPQVTDRAEQTHRRVEALLERQRAHVGFDQGDVGEVRPCFGQHSRIDIGTGDVVPESEVTEVTTGPAGHVEQSPCPRSALLDQVVDVRRFLAVVLPRAFVEQVVDVGRVRNTPPRKTRNVPRR